MRLSSLLLIASLCLPACGDDDGGSSTSDASTADAAGTQTCRATFTWWQKDAYLDAAGRGSDFWPPHTTTTLRVDCPADGTTVTSAEMTNHGTAVSATDMSGSQILQAMRTETVDGPRDELMALATAYQDCECGTTFLSLDALSDTAVMDLVNELGTYLNANVTCPKGLGGVSQLIADLSNGDIAAALTLAPMCTFNAGSWEEGLNTALSAVIAATSDVLDDYHVCNNDALLQATLWDAYVQTGNVGTCDAASTTCNGPAWYLQCTDADRTGCLPSSD